MPAAPGHWIVSGYGRFGSEVAEALTGGGFKVTVIDPDEPPLDTFRLVQGRGSDRASLEALRKSGPYAGHVAGDAVAIALVTPDPLGPGQPLSVVWDVGGAAAQMMLVAWELGIGSCPATVYEQPLVKEQLGLPDGIWCEYILSFGYPKDPERLTAPNRPGGRRPHDEVVFKERWDSR